MNKIHLLIIITACLVSSNANAFGLGGGKSGKKFDYEACGKIREGKTTYQQAEKMLGAKPLTTGKNGSLFYPKYYYEKHGGLGLSKLGIKVGSVKGVSYECVVLHNRKGVVTTVNMQETDISANSGGL